MSLIPKKSLVISLEIAATLGLEEAVLLHVLAEIRDHGQAQERNGFHWFEVPGERLLDLLPFWSQETLQRVAASLREKGVLLIGSAPFSRSGLLRFAFNEQHPGTQSHPAKVAHGANLISRQWQPEPDVLAQLAQYGVPRQFALDQVGEFVTYWSERAEPQHSWGSKFLKQVLRLWREEETRQARQDREIPLSPAWRPSLDAMDILGTQAGISRNFIEDAIPEFVLYWQERGTVSSTWNTQFVQHVKRQWAKYNASLERDCEPHVIQPDWQPSEDLYEVLRLANIPQDFARQQVPEFLLFWRESGQAHNSWNTKFLQHVKRQWVKHSHQQQESGHERRQDVNQSVSTRHRSLAEDLTDRSWAT